MKRLYKHNRIGIFILKHCFEYPAKSMKYNIDWNTYMSRNSSSPFEKLKQGRILEDSFLFKKNQTPN